jgi:hypothetical protein
MPAPSTSGDSRIMTGKRSPLRRMNTVSKPSRDCGDGVLARRICWRRS